MKLRIPWLYLEGRRQKGEGGGVFPLFVHSDGHVPVGAGIGGHDRQRFHEQVLGFLHLPPGRQGGPQVVIGPVIVRDDPDGVFVKGYIVPPVPRLFPGQKTQGQHHRKGQSAGDSTGRRTLDYACLGSLRERGVPF